MKYGYDRNDRELELIIKECSELSDEPLYIDHGTKHSKDKLYYVKGLGWNTKEWAKLFLAEWNRAVELWHNGYLFDTQNTGYYWPDQIYGQKEYANICCTWIIPNGMAEPHVVAEGG